MNKPEAARDAVLEILAENLPAAFVAPAAARLKEKAAGLLAADSLACESVEAYGTCRRLTLRLAGVAPRAADKPAAKALAGIFPLAVTALSSPADMAWDASGFRFARPVRGLLALYGEKPVTFSLAGLRSGRVTAAAGARGDKRLTVPSASRYFAALAHANVLVKEADRLAALRRGLDSLAGRMKLRVETDAETLAENLYLAECPVCVLSGFSHELLRLPRAAVIRALKDLSFFAVTDGKGELQPYFVGVRDGASRGQRNVEEGYRAALEERLSASAPRR